MNRQGYGEFETGENGARSVGQAIPIKKPPMMRPLDLDSPVASPGNSWSSPPASPSTPTPGSKKLLHSFPISSLLTLERFGYVVCDINAPVFVGKFACPQLFYTVNPKITEFAAYSWDARSTTPASDIEEILWIHRSLYEYLNFLLQACSDQQLLLCLVEYAGALILHASILAE